MASKASPRRQLMMAMGMTVGALVLGTLAMVGLQRELGSQSESDWYPVTGQEHADMVEAGVIDSDTVCKVSVPFGDSALTVCDNGHTEES